MKNPNVSKEDHARAQWYMGYLYYFGVGLDKNYAKAVGFFKKSAKNHNAIALSYLGHAYFHGNGVKRSYAIAIKWFKKSNNAVSKRYLGIMLYHGFGVAQDRKKAFEFYRKSATHGDEEAMCRLAESYRYAQGCRKNYQKSYGWFLAVNPEVSKGWGLGPELIEYFEDVLTPEQIRSAKLWAKNWEPIAKG
jgi:TPR repeat protein